MSWLMKSTAKPCSACSRRTFSRIECWTTTSSPVVGSSSSTNFGSSARARARLTRWRIPPDSSCGIGADELVVDDDHVEQLADAPGHGLAAQRRSAARWRRGTAPSTRTTGLSEFMLLWKTVEMSRQRSARSSSSASVRDVGAVEA